METARGPTHTYIHTYIDRGRDEGGGTREGAVTRRARKRVITFNP
jgi:hypothetical protein